ncbi:sphingomyelin phosphodiesterase-like [Haliotis asinina]|uniref:sphingomyelin phosphodiesterase-like n=1 Tax=Haliotis asinina TaxID=109174 RepID=UPI00353232CD
MSFRAVLCLTALCTVTLVTGATRTEAKFGGHFEMNARSAAKKYSFTMGGHRGELGTITGESDRCFACKLLVNTIRSMVMDKRPEEDIARAVIDICKQFHFETDRVCAYIVPEYKDMAMTVAQHTALNPNDICGILVGPDCATPYFPTDMWNVTLPDTPKPPVIPPKPPAPGSPKVRFLQLTDIHIDLMYQEGANAICHEPLCCRSNDGKPEAGVPGAGKWGDYRTCDSPLIIVDNLFQHLATKTDEFDFIIFTGDIAAHDVWNQTRTEQLAALDRLVSYFDKYLPGKQVYFCAGNHDTAPCNSFPPDYIKGNLSQEWMYAAMATHWTRWLPGDTKETILRGGFYTFSPFPGFRIISVNNIFCYINNWWLFINTTDPNGELQWLAETLQKAEDAGEKVFILGHMPTNCLKAWSWNYYNIVSRYESTIVGQFNGHTHSDEFRVYYDVANLTRPVNVAYVGGSVTTMSNNNPNYRIYTMDGFYTNSSFAVLDYEDYIFDISANNNNNNSTNPTWKFEYSPLTAYGMNGSTPADWSDLVYRMRDDDELFNKFNRHRSRGGDSTPCTHDCKFEVLCLLKSGRSEDPRLCEDL